MKSNFKTLKPLLNLKTLLLALGLSMASCLFAQSPEEKLLLENQQLPKISAPIANYVNVVRVGNLLFLSGKGPKNPDGSDIKGKLGHELSIEQGYAAAQNIAFQHLAVIKQEIGSLNKVKRIVKVLGMVNSMPDFYDHPKVINGYSDMMVKIFGEKGKHARSAVGTASLPNNMAVEIEVIVEIEEIANW